MSKSKEDIFSWHSIPDHILIKGRSSLDEQEKAQEKETLAEKKKTEKKAKKNE
jgi:hypothetical protein